MHKRMSTRKAEPVETVKGYWLREISTKHTCGYEDCFTCPFKDCIVDTVTTMTKASKTGPYSQNPTPEAILERKRRMKIANAKRRDKLKAQGLCLQCGQRPPDEGLTRCAECRARDKAREVIRRQQRKGDKK